MKHRILWLICGLSLFLGSCVPVSKLKEVSAQLSQTEGRLQEQMEVNEKLSASNKEMDALYDKLQKQYRSLLADSARLASGLESSTQQFIQLERDYRALEQARETLAKSSERESARMVAQIQAMQTDLQRREADLQRLSGEISARQSELQQLSAELDIRTRRLGDLELLLARQDSSVRALRSAVSSALVGIENNGLTVRIQNGKVYVSMDEELLFKSGSTTVDPSGVSALRKLARVLEQNPEINITIEGHTDNVPLRPGAAMNDNWDLSVKRATAIVRILLDGTSINPVRLTASGKGEFLPVAPNTSPESRQQNRRTEIILTPRLDELFRMME